MDSWVWISRQESLGYALVHVRQALRRALYVNAALLGAILWRVW